MLKAPSEITKVMWPVHLKVAQGQDQVDPGPEAVKRVHNMLGITSVFTPINSSKATHTKKARQHAKPAKNHENISW